MAYTDQKGNAVTAGTAIAVAVRDHANKAVLVEGVASGPYTALGETYFTVPWKPTEVARAVARMTGVATGVLDNAVVYNAT